MDFESDEALIARIKYLEENEGAYYDFIKQPIFNDNIISIYFDQARIKDFFEQIFSGSKQTEVRSFRKTVGILLRKKRNFENKFLKPQFR
jgi:hypothetical protein